jgi:photosystem II P680 reaction center D1 protein
VISNWAEVINRANLGMEVIHESNAHNFVFDLATPTATPLALKAPAIGSCKQG